MLAVTRPASEVAVDAARDLPRLVAAHPGPGGSTPGGQDDGEGDQAHPERPA
jgi:hypothetical protein